MSKRLAAVLGVSFSEIENLQTVFQNGLTFTLAYRVTSELDTSQENLVLMLISIVIVLFIFVYWQGFLTRQTNEIIKMDNEEYSSNATPKASLASVSVYPLQLALFLCTIVNQVLVQLLATMTSSWLYLLPPNTGDSELKQLLPVTLLLLSLFWLAQTAINHSR